MAREAELKALSAVRSGDLFSKIMNAKLFRENAETRDTDISFSHVGPGHERAYFSLIPIAGYAAVNRLDAHPPFAPPFKIYSMSGSSPKEICQTISDAKLAVREWITHWLRSVPETVTWAKEDTGVHFTGLVDDIQVSNYYFCPKAVNNWHAGFRVWFGGTYYVTDFETPDQARAAVQTTYTRWLAHARQSLLNS